MKRPMVELSGHTLTTPYAGWVTSGTRHRAAEAIARRLADYGDIRGPAMHMKYIRGQYFVSIPLSRRDRR